MTEQNGTHRDTDPAEQDLDSAAEETAAPVTDAAPGEPVEAAEIAGSDLAQELAETKDKLLRSFAEMENLRKRSQKEKEDTAKFAISGFAKDVLNVADNLRRALGAVPEEAAGDPVVKALAEGVELTERELLSAFDRHGIVKIDPAGEKFDHRYHEALFEVPTAEAPPGTVVQVMEVGYVLNDRLLRPARVGIAKTPPETDAPERVDTTA